jgi:hypothetical protein
LYIGIGGPGGWYSGGGSAPSGHYLTLLHDETLFVGDRQVTATWTAQPDQVGAVQLSVLYTVADSIGQSLIESWPVGFRVRA